MLVKDQSTDCTRSFTGRLVKKDAMSSRDTDRIIYSGREIVVDRDGREPTLVIAGERIDLERVTVPEPDGSDTEQWWAPGSYYPAESPLALGRLLVATRDAELEAEGRAARDSR